MSLKQLRLVVYLNFPFSSPIIYRMAFMLRCIYTCILMLRFSVLFGVHEVHNEAMPAAYNLIGCIPRKMEPCSHKSAIFTMLVCCGVDWGIAANAPTNRINLLSHESDTFVQNYKLHN